MIGTILHDSYVTIYHIRKMILLLRISISTLFFTIALLAFIQPKGSLSYINQRYLQFGAYVKDLSSETISLPSISLLSYIFAYVLGSLLVIGGLMVILNVRKGIIVFAYIFGIISTILHMPYTDKEMIKQIRKLIFTFIVFFSMLILVSLKDKPKSKEKTD